MSTDEDEEGMISYEIIYRILNHIENKGKSLKTRILYASNLNSRSLEKYLEFLLRNHLVSEARIDEKRFYLLTTKGREFLYRLRKIRDEIMSSHAKKLSELIKDEYSKKRINKTYELSNKKRLRVIIINNDSTIKEAAADIMLNYVDSIMDNEELLCVVPSRHYDKLLEILNNIDIKNINNSLRFYVYNEREDSKDLSIRVTNVLRNLELRYDIMI